jgi:hypothetical protein
MAGRICAAQIILNQGSVLSQKFAYKVFLMRAVFSQPRQVGADLFNELLTQDSSSLR